ncbi:ATP-dependent RecD-like DNA helicase [Acholeplasma sp. OttesenSCG-928-E16]|nr:ATP-dependent RecD-like DNA helicase [Acholeplasma sp. OttesenSCG-928-E16]
MDKIRGNINRYIYHNEENGYSIALLKTAHGTITIVGYFPKLSSDFEYEFTGEYIYNQKYGEQLKIETFTRVEFENKEGLVNYLSSSLFTGIGEKTALKIVDAFGNDSINKIIANKEILKEIGFNIIKMERLYQELLENQTNENTLIELYGFGITPKTAMKLINKYQLFTIEIIKNNPYQLIDDIDGIGFIKADEIALKIGILEDDPRRLEAAIMYTLNMMCNSEGNTYVFKDDLINYTKRNLRLDVGLENYLLLLIEKRKIVLEEDRYYLANLYNMEISIANKIKEIIGCNQEANDDYLGLIELIEKKTLIKYTDQQKEAISTAMNNNISIITGGPGTGKTTIISLLLEVFCISLKLNIKDDHITSKVALAAPTGRAAKRMKEVLDLEARTIHSLLGYSFDGTFKYDNDNRLPHDLIIVDEFSMVDIYLANKLFEAIKPTAKIVIVGDVDQLPSVGPGQILLDLINSNKIPTIKLSVIHRQSNDSKIIELSYKVNNQLLSYSDLSSNDELFISSVKSNDMASYINKLVIEAIDLGFNIYEDIQILIPQYKGLTGIDKINQTLQNHFIDKKSDKMTYGEKEYYVGDKVIQLVNDPKRQIMNGDIGFVEEISYNKDDDKYMIVNFDNKKIQYLKSDLEELNLAYAISIHKSQGSEYMFVIMPIEPGYRFMLKKELIYTAITRSRKYLSIIGDAKLLIYASNNLSEKRKTSLERRI